MADESDIIQKIALLGADQIRKELQALGADGEAALKKLEQAGGGDLAKGVRALMPEVAKFDEGLQGAAASAGKLPGILNKIGAAMRGLSGRTGLGNLEGDAKKATFAANNLGVGMRSLGKDIRALGRTVDLAGISGFGRALSLAGRNAALIAFPAAVAGVERLANSAATAASNFADMAASVQQTPAAFGRFTNVVVALGGSLEDAGKVAGTFEKNVSSALQTVVQQSEAVAAARDNLEGTRDSFADASRGLDQIARQQQRLTSQLVNGRISLQAYHEAQAQLNDSAAEVQRNISRAGDAIDKAQRSFDKARQATDPLVEAFARVGVVLTDSFKKLPIDQQLDRIAAGFKNLGPNIDKTKLAVQLFGDEMGRKFVKALSGGEEGLKKFRAEGERLRPTFTQAQIDIGDNLVAATGKLVSALASLKDAFGLAVSPAFTAFFTKLADQFVSLRPSIAALGAAFGSVLKPFLDGVVIVVQLLISLIGLLTPLFNLLASAINKVFGTNLTGVQIFTVAIVALVAAIAPMVPLILLAAAAIAQLVEQLKLVNFTALLQPAIDLWASLTKLFNDGAIFISNAFNTAIEFVKGLWTSLTSTISGWANSAISFVQGVIDKIKELARTLAALTGLGGDTAGSTAGFATGGEVHGAGTSRSDSIWARLSNGEFVIQAAAVRKYGTNFLHAINRMALGPRSFPGFNMGGLVDALAPMRAFPAYADGGAVKTGGPQSVLNLTIGQEAFFGLRAPEDTAAKLTRFARRKGVRASGRKPSWYGGGAN